MKKSMLGLVAIGLLIAGPAMAADMGMPLKAPPAPVAPLFSWTGFYLGGNLGAGWNDGNLTDSLFGVNWSGNNNNVTFLGGGQVGVNYQINSVVLGVEGDFDWFANNNNSATVTAFGETVTGSNNGRWLTTLTGRLGYAWDRVLFYGKGGGAWVGSNNFTLTNVATGSSVSFANNNTNTGWTAGAGVEWAFYDNWTARVEYDYVGLNGATFTVPATFPVVSGDVFTTHNRNIQTVTVGINYLFNFGQPATRYCRSSSFC
jgi:outer membrane immunogenic protein